MPYKGSDILDRELKKGSAELLILSLVEDRPRHGYEIGTLIEQRSGGLLRFNVASLYPLLYRLEKRRWIQGRWVEKAGQRRRRYYRLTPEGKKILAAQRNSWRDFVEAMNLITGIEPRNDQVHRNPGRHQNPRGSRFKPPWKSHGQPCLIGNLKSECVCVDCVSLLLEKRRSSKNYLNISTIVTSVCCPTVHQRMRPSER